MNDTTTDTSPAELEHDDERPLWGVGAARVSEARTTETAAPPTPHQVQQACDLINSIERNLIGRLADIESRMQPADVERLHWHIITALGEHTEAIANVFAAAVRE